MKIVKLEIYETWFKCYVHVETVEAPDDVWHLHNRGRGSVLYQVRGLPVLVFLVPV